MMDEFKLIDSLISRFSGKPRGDSPLQIPPGDDACVLKPLNRPVITTDTQREGVHFSLDWQTPEDVGWKAVAITLSDLAASFAVPVSLFVNLALPAAYPDAVAEKLYDGIHKALTHYRCTLGGGNISGGRDLGLDLFAVGEGGDNPFPARSGAEPGFGVYCTGPLGLAAAGLDALKRGSTGFPGLVSRFKYPSARFDAAAILAVHQVGCAIDVSDGLAGDALHIAKASNITIEFRLAPDRIDAELSEYCRQTGLKTESVLFSGGEDYELLFACLPETFADINRELPDAYPVGRCLKFQKTHLKNLPPDAASFHHRGV